MKLSIRDLDLKGQRVFIRVDFNVPLKNGVIGDDTRIRSSLPTIQYALDHGATVVLASHLGRPKGKVNPEMSLRPIADQLSALLGKPVVFAADCIGDAAKNAKGDVLLLENLRFHPEEEKNDPVFARRLAALGDVYVNDAFSAAHRAHASTEALAHLLPHAAGRLMQAELEALGKALEAPTRPVAALVGGAKVSTKLDLLNFILAKVDFLIIGGAMANTLLFAAGKEVGKSLCERELAETARGILAKAAGTGCELVLPVDAVVALELKANVATEIVDIDRVPEDAMILDIGPASVAEIGRRLAACRTLVRNGPLGAFETPPFDAGTVAVARRAAELTEAGTLLSVAGGGDTVAALAHAGVEQKFTYVSTAGGAFLEFLEGRELPG